MYGLLGEKLGHSFSKEIHESINNYIYNLIEVKKEDFYVSIKIDSSLETFSVLPDIYINQ